MSNDIWVDESPYSCTEGDVLPFAVTYEGASAVSAAAATMAIYKNGTGADLSGTMLSGSITASGNILSLKTITLVAGNGGNQYVVVVGASVDGIFLIRKIELEVQKAKARQ
jgi:hypothetical protein